MTEKETEIRSITIDHPLGPPNGSCVRSSMFCLCHVQGTAKDGNEVAQAVFAELHQQDPGSGVPENWHPGGLPSAQPNSSGKYTLHNTLFTACDNVGLARWIKIYAQFPQSGSTMPRFVANSKAFLAKCCIDCPPPPSVQNVVSSPIETPFRQQLDEQEKSTTNVGWTFLNHLPVDNYPTGPMILPAGTPEDVIKSGKVRKIAVFAKDVAWQFDNLNPTSLIYTSSGTGFVAPSEFAFPGASQYSVILYQPQFEFPAISHVITATHFLNPQVLAFDRRLPVFAQVNDYIGDAYTNNSGGFGLVLKVLS